MLTGARFALGIQVVLSVGSPSVAHAQTAPVAERAAPEQALDLYELAREHYREGHYNDAAELLEQALVIDPDVPILLENLARTYERLGDGPRAAGAYRRLAEVTSDPAQREEATLSAVRIERQTRTAEAGPVEHAPPVLPPPTRMDEGVLVGLVIASGVLTAAAIAGGVTALVLQDDLHRPIGAGRTYDDWQSQRALLGPLALTADLVGAAAATLWVVTGIVWIVREAADGASVSVRPGLIEGSF